MGRQESRGGAEVTEGRAGGGWEGRVKELLDNRRRVSAAAAVIADVVRRHTPNNIITSAFFIKLLCLCCFCLGIYNVKYTLAWEQDDIPLCGG